LYVVDGTIFNTGGSNISNRNLTATTGWGSSSYTGDRAAAPFAILDAMYSGMQLVLATEPTAVFPPLDAFWSTGNTTAMGTPDDGGIGTSYYTSNPDGGTPNPSLFLLGDADEDTEEFDDHVVLHEWGHYFEDNFSRSDSIGGQHGLGDSLDPRVAFGEGFATALAAIGLGLLIGWPLAFGISLFIASLTDKLRSFDLVSFGLVPIVLAMLAICAAWIPARRTARIHPTEALRED
jgi:hypothetical protein